MASKIGTLHAVALHSFRAAKYFSCMHNAVPHIFGVRKEDGEAFQCLSDLDAIDQRRQRFTSWKLFFYARGADVRRSQ
jgi:hypothetical protein